MSEVKKIATRESYGNALVEIGKNMKIWLYWMPTLPELPKPLFSRKYSRKDTSTAVSQRAI